ncbi:Peptidyl-prolyl cis-trans isomerase cyp10 [Microbotryomycetes sp. JL201]|nr:Peptidyl-prolyl cis-trans isomerase cyp10 [Microbotryomycetes sp. JL201]
MAACFIGEQQIAPPSTSLHPNSSSRSDELDEYRRNIKGFMVQTGDPTGTGKGGQSIYGKPFADEIRSTLKFNARGIVAMANSGHSFSLPTQNNHILIRNTVSSVGKLSRFRGDSKSAQRQPWPNRVIDGLDTALDAIEKVPVNEKMRPLQPIRLEKMSSPNGAELVLASFDTASLRPAIDTILRNSERDTNLYPQYDIKSQKRQVDELIMDAFNTIFESSTEEPARLKVEPSSTPAPLPSPPPQPRPPPPRPSQDTELSDAELARQLAADLNGPTRRTTRAGPSASRSGRKSTKARKSRATVDEDDDSDSVSTSTSSKPRKRSGGGGGGFNKPHLLSEALADVCGATILSRPAVTKHLWQYIKANDLQDPNKKTDILPDEKLKKVLPFTRINSFTMAKHISQVATGTLTPHLYPYEAKKDEDLVESDEE